MRPPGDRRPAAVVKLELLEEFTRRQPIGIVVDDDPAVLDAVRRAGHPVFAAEWEARTADGAASPPRRSGIRRSHLNDGTGPR